MATVINNPDTSSGTGVGVILGVIITIIVLALVLLYGVPALRGARNTSGGNTNIPERVDINVNTPQ